MTREPCRFYAYDSSDSTIHRFDLKREVEAWIKENPLARSRIGRYDRLTYAAKLKHRAGEEWPIRVE